MNWTWKTSISRDVGWLSQESLRCDHPVCLFLIECIIKVMQYQAPGLSHWIITTSYRKTEKNFRISQFITLYLILVTTDWVQSHVSWHPVFLFTNAPPGRLFFTRTYYQPTSHQYFSTNAWNLYVWTGEMMFSRGMMLGVGGQEIQWQEIFVSTVSENFKGLAQSRKALYAIVNPTLLAWIFSVEFLYIVRLEQSIPELCLNVWNKSWEEGWKIHWINQSEDLELNYFQNVLTWGAC